MERSLSSVGARIDSNPNLNPERERERERSKSRKWNPKVKENLRTKAKSHFLIMENNIVVHIMLPLKICHLVFFFFCLFGKTKCLRTLNSMNVNLSCLISRQIYWLAVCGNLLETEANPLKLYWFIFFIYFF